MAQTPLPLVTLGFFATFQFVPRFDLTHLWFLHPLLVLYSCVLPLRTAWQRWLDPDGTRLASADRQFTALCTSRWNVLLLALVTTPCCS